MQVTEVRVTIPPGHGTSGPRSRFLAYASIVLDGEFLVRDLRVIDAPAGLLVVMPNRRRTVHCGCRAKMPVDARFCPYCGLRSEQGPPEPEAHREVYTDLAHPITQACRDTITVAVLAEYEAELAALRGGPPPGEPDDDGDGGAPLRGRIARPA